MTNLASLFWDELMFLLSIVFELLSLWIRKLLFHVMGNLLLSLMRRF